MKPQARTCPVAGYDCLNRACSAEVCDLDRRTPQAAPPVHDERAVIGEGVSIGQGAKVWPLATVIRGARIGDGGSVGSCAIVDGARIGPRARIGHGAQLHPGTVAGADLFVGPGAIVCNDMWPWLSAKDFDLAALIEGRAISVLIEDSVTIGAGAIVLAGVRLGRGCVVAAGAVVSTDVPADRLYTRDGLIVALPAPGARMKCVAGC